MVQGKSYFSYIAGRKLRSWSFLNKETRKCMTILNTHKLWPRILTPMSLCHINISRSIWEYMYKNVYCDNFHSSKKLESGDIKGGLWVNYVLCGIADWKKRCKRAFICTSYKNEWQEVLYECVRAVCACTYNSMKAEKTHLSTCVSF